MDAPISKNLIEPKIISNILYVDSIEEFDKIELAFNQTCLAFDNNRQCFYVKTRDRFGEYSQTKIYFYNDFATQISGIKGITKDEFIEKCKQVNFDEFKCELAIKFFLEKKKPYEVWKWTCQKGMHYEEDTIRVMKSRLKAKLLQVLTL